MQDDERGGDEGQVPEAVVEPPVPDPEPTGDEAVDAALRGLAGALRDSRDGESRVAAFETAHRALQDRLADVEG